jgi:hypothetical protein
MTLHETHSALVQAVNGSTTEITRLAATNYLQGFRECVRVMTGGDGTLGCLIIEADLHYINQGMDRPMCGGVWLDWKPSEEYSNG